MRVLLIEDDSATAQSIELMLKSENFNVYTTDLGEEGIDLGKLYDYDIIMLDLNLPDMSGYEVLRTLRVSKVKTPILILSGVRPTAPDPLPPCARFHAVIPRVDSDCALDERPLCSHKFAQIL